MSIDATIGQVLVTTVDRKPVTHEYDGIHRYDDGSVYLVKDGKTVAMYGPGELHWANAAGTPVHPIDYEQPFTFTFDVLQLRLIGRSNPRLLGLLPGTTTAVTISGEPGGLVTLSIESHAQRELLAILLPDVLAKLEEQPVGRKPRIVADNSPATAAA